MSRAYPNATEQRFAERARSRGFRVTKKGWPDFMCFHPDGRVVCVEVKRRCRRGNAFHRLSPAQVETLKFLAAHGIECFISDGVVTERFDPTRHGHRLKRRRVAEGARRTSRPGNTDRREG